MKTRFIITLFLLLGSLYYFFTAATMSVINLFEMIKVWIIQGVHVAVNTPDLYSFRSVITRLLIGVALMLIGDVISPAKDKNEPTS